jgi:hypothetical protein
MQKPFKYENETYVYQFDIGSFIHLCIVTEYDVCQLHQ